MKHLSMLELLQTVNGVFTGSRHLNYCDECLQRAELLKEFQMAAKRVPFISTKKTRLCPSTSELAEFMENGRNRAVAIKEHLRTCDHCFDHASYYYSESDEMQMAEEATTPRRYKKAALALVQKQRIKKALPYQVKRWILAPMPAYAAAILCVALISNAPVPSIAILNGAPQYDVYRKEVDSMPLFHFSRHGEKISTRAAKIKLFTTRRKVRFEWEPVEGTAEYYFVIQELENGVPSMVKQLKTGSTSVTLPRELFKPDKRYLWITAGGISPDRYFESRVEFSISSL